MIHRVDGHPDLINLVTEYFQYLNHFHLLEFIAALAGSYYIQSRKSVKKNDWYLVIFLWVILFVEIIGVYAQYAYYSNYEYLSFIKNTPFERNYWLYNIKNIFNYLVYVYFFKSYLTTKKLQYFLNFAMLVFFITSLVNLLNADVFFKAHSSYIAMAGSTLLLISIGGYFYEFLKSDKILYFKYSLPVYIALGLLVFELTISPLKIYSNYFNENISPEFVSLFSFAILVTNIWLYSIFTFGFLLCSQKKNSYS